jgi:hypothetical protein
MPGHSRVQEHADAGLQGIQSQLVSWYKTRFKLQDQETCGPSLVGKLAADAMADGSIVLFVKTSYFPLVADFLHACSALS